MQGGPHNHTIGGISVALHEAQSPEYRDYTKRVVTNAKALAAALTKRGHTLVTNGTDNHIVLWNLRPHGLTGSKLEAMSNYANVTLNKNTIAGDKSAMTPHGIRLGTPACTTRGYTEAHMDTVAEFLDRICKESLKIQQGKGKKLSEFVQGVQDSDEVKKISSDVEEFASQFEWPGLSI
jgi:glycine hydroxymethyltransferase